RRWSSSTRGPTWDPIPRPALRSALRPWRSGEPGGAGRAADDMRHPGRPALLLLLGVLGLLVKWLDRSPAVLSGQVCTAAGPVEGARVRIKGRPAMTWTDGAGAFRLPGLFRQSDRVTAATAGYLIAGASASQKPLVLRLTRLPTDDWDRYQWVRPEPDP